MDIGLENRLYRKLICVLLGRSGRLIVLWGNKGDRTLGKIRAIGLWEDKGDRTSLALEQKLLYRIHLIKLGALLAEPRYLFSTQDSS